MEIEAFRDPFRHFRDTFRDAFKDHFRETKVIIIIIIIIIIIVIIIIRDRLEITWQTAGLRRSRDCHWRGAMQRRGSAAPPRQPPAIGSAPTAPPPATENADATLECLVNS